MNIHSLFVYPVKSLSGIQVSSFSLDDFGPVGDRRWMIVNSERRFVTQRQLPELARIETKLHPDGRVSVDIPGQGQQSFLTPGNREARVLVWQDWVKAVYAEGEVSELLSHFCGMKLDFVYMPEESFRRVDAGRVTEYRRVSFADGFPLLVANLSSLDELNARLEHPVDIRRFRPNIVIEGASPWEEDRWRALAIGNVRFSLVKPCSRCVMTTVDPDTGHKAPDMQPLRTLGQYRRTPDGVIFGMNAIHESPGAISVGDPVTKLEPEKS